MNRQVFCAALVFLLLSAACGGEHGSPIAPGGEVPPLVAALPDAPYLGIAWLDGETFLTSEFGVFLTSRLATPMLFLHMAGIHPAEDMREIAVAIRFEARAWPNVSSALQPIALIRTDLDLARLEQALAQVPHEVTTFGRTRIFSVEIAPGQNLFVAIPGAGMLLITSAGDLAEKTIDLLRGEGKSVTTGSHMQGVLERADKTATGWFVLRHTPESRNLLQMLPSFEYGVGVLRAGESLEGLCVLAFADDEGARRTVKQHEINVGQMREFMDRFGAGEAGGAQSRLINDTMELLDVRQQGPLAIFSVSLTPDWLTRLLQQESQPPQPAETEPAQ